MQKLFALSGILLLLTGACVAANSNAWVDSSALLLDGNIIQGSVYYVAPTGSDANSGSASAPWATLQHAANTVAAGDEVVVLDGAYAGFRLESGGTAVNRITFRAAGDNAIINADGPTGDGIRLQNVSYVTIEGFNIEGASEFGIAHRGAAPNAPVHGLIIRGNHVTASGSVGMYLSEIADSLVENNIIADAGNHGIYLANSGSDNTTIRGNDISGSKNAAIHFNGDRFVIGGDGIISGLLVEQNILHENGQNGLNMDGVQDSLIQNNLIYDNALNGIRAFRIDGQEGPRGLRIINNTIHIPADGYWCVRITEDLGDILVFNNTLLNDNPYTGSIALDNTSGFASANNAVTDRFTPDRGDTMLSLAGWQLLGYDVNSFIAQPADLFVDAAAADYRLKPGATAVDTGLAQFNGQAAPTSDITGAARPSGAGFDVGAYEFTPELVLNGRPANQTIYLDWEVNTTLPVTTTWQINYYNQNSHPAPITNLDDTIRAYTLTGLTNYVPYTITLNAIVSSSPILTDTVVVMPTDLFVHLPLVMKRP